MQLINTAFQSTQFYIVALVLGLIFGYGGVVHLMNVLGFGEFGWPDVPLRFKIADVFWGVLDFTAVIGTVFKAPIGPVCLVLAAATQIVAYGFFPRFFATKPEHLQVLRGMVVFHAVVLAILGASFFAATRPSN